MPPPPPLIDPTEGELCVKDMVHVVHPADLTSCKKVSSHSIGILTASSTKSDIFKSRKDVHLPADKGFLETDESTARTVSTSRSSDDDMSLREKYSFTPGSLYVTSSNSTIQIGNLTSESYSYSPVRLTRNDMIRIAEAAGEVITDKPQPCKKVRSLMDDDDDDHDDDIGIKTTLENKLSSESDYDAKLKLNPTSTASIAGDFYKGYSQDVKSSSSRSMFAKNTLNTSSSQVGGCYKVMSTETEEPLSCREKLDQPALGCDEEIWSRSYSEDYLWGPPTPVGKEELSQLTEEEEDRSDSIFSAFTCWCT